MASLVPVADVTVGPVGSAELCHQPQLVDPLAGGDSDELVLETVPGNPVVVHLSALYTCTVLYTLYTAAARARCPWGRSRSSGRAAVEF